MFLGVAIGVVAGVGAIAFFVAIDWSTSFFLGRLAGFSPPSPRGEAAPVFEAPLRPWVLPLVVGLGGLISGIIVFGLAPEAEGHGTDAAIEAFHERGGRIRPRIPPIKLLASAVTIGSGGSAGREGPTAQIAAGFGSWLGDVMRLSAADRRIAMAAGMGAGIGSIFKAPLGGAILSAEILYLRDFEVNAIVPGFIASVTGYTIFAAWSGWEPVFGPSLGFRFTSPESLVWYVALGAAAGLVGIGYVRAFYGTRDLFHRLPVPRALRPALAGVAVGLIAIAFPQVLSMGYGWLQFAIEDSRAQLALGTMAALIALKIVATSLTIGSGGSGGVFAPGLFIGGMVGGTMWGSLHTHVPGMPPVPEPFVVVGMAALFGGVAKAPIAVMLMVVEMTGEFSMIVPAMAATSVAYLVTGNVSIYESQVATRGESPAHRGEHAIALIDAVTVAQAMEPNVPMVEGSEPLERAAARLKLQPGLPLVVVEGGALVGVLDEADVDRGRAATAVCAAAAARRVPALSERQSLLAALQQMTGADVSALPVVRPGYPSRTVGVLTLRSIADVLGEHRVGLRARPETVRARQDDPLRRITVDEAMSTEFVAVEPGMDVRTLAQLLAQRDEHAAVVVAADGDLAGIVTLTDVERAFSADRPLTVGDVATREVQTAESGQTLADVLARVGEEPRQLPVLRSADGRRTVVGMISRRDVVSAYLRHTPRITAGPLSSREGEGVVERTDRANGLTLAELGLPPDALVTVVVRDGVPLIPRGSLRLRTGDRIRFTTARGDVASVLEALRGGPSPGSY